MIYFFMSFFMAIGILTILFIVIGVIRTMIMIRRRNKIMKSCDKLISTIDKMIENEDKFVPGVITKDEIHCMKCHTPKSKPKKSCAQGRRNHKWVEKKNNKK